MIDVDKPIRKARPIHLAYCKWNCTNEDAEMCSATSPTGYPCTRRKGHPGDHAACGWNRHGIKTWRKQK